MTRAPKKLLSIEVPDWVPERRVCVPKSLPIVGLTSSVFISSYHAAKDLEILRAVGITHILNLAPARQCPNLYVDDFTYCAIPLPDNPCTDLAGYLPEAVEFIDSAVKEGGKVLVHCLRGKSRAPTIACAYLISILTFPTDKALKLLKKKQPFADPNFGFISQLKTIRQDSPIAVKIA